MWVCVKTLRGFGMFSVKQMQAIVDGLDEEFLVEDSEQHINHDECSAGTDTKKRLYMRKTSTGVLFHCHHCGESGFLRTDKRILAVDKLVCAKERMSESMPSTKNSKFYLSRYNVAHNDLGLAPLHIITWLYSYEFTEEMVVKYQIRFDDKFVYLPYVDSAGTAYMQIRTFNGTGPKYVTVKVRDVPVLFHSTRWYSEDDDDCTTVFLCEDLMSAYKLHTAGANVLCLCGTHLTENAKLAILGYPNVVTWLDDDFAGQHGALVISRDLRTFGVVPRNFKFKQPKEVELDALTAYVKELSCTM